MMKRVAGLAAALAVMVFVVAAVAADKVAAKDSTVVGTITKVSAADLTITVTDKDGKDHALTISKTATIQCDGKDCKLADLDPKKVVSITATLNPDHKDVADKLDAKTTK
jgi:uncharacterized cupredoxin-like copper-binding protein